MAFNPGLLMQDRGLHFREVLSREFHTDAFGYLIQADLITVHTLERIRHTLDDRAAGSSSTSRSIISPLRSR